MGTVEDIRNVLQDFLTPELRELKYRIENLERNMAEGFSRVDRHFEQLTRHVDQRITSLETQLSLSERVAPGAESGKPQEAIGHDSHH